MNTIENLKTAADLIETQAARIAQLEALASAKTAQVVAPSVEHVSIAKRASDALLAKRLLTSEASRDAFAAKVAGSHQACLEQLVKVSGFLTPALRPTGEGDRTKSPEPTVDAWATAYAARHGAA